MTPLRLAFAALFVVAACNRAPTLDPHQKDALITGLQRVEGEGPYVPGHTERFRAETAEQGTLTFAATGGKLEQSGAEVSWELPDADDAELTVTLATLEGRAQTQTFKFALARSAALAATPGPIDTATDTTDCRLAFDGAGNAHVAYRRSLHPSLWWAKWTGTAWQTQQVDGMGFELGGAVQPDLALQVASDGTPHFLYYLDTSTDSELWYATRSGSNWLREQVDGTVHSYGSGRLGLALDGSGRPVAFYTGYNTGTGYPVTTLAARTAASTWSQQIISLAAASPCTYVYAQGGVRFSGSTANFIASDSCNKTIFATWTSGATASAVKAVSNLGAGFSPLSFDGARWFTMVSNNLLHVKPVTGLADATVTPSEIEVNTPASYDAVFGTKPNVGLIHGGALEYVTTDASGYFTYTQIASAVTDRVGIALDGAGAAHFCYHSGGKVQFQ
jgi:hypothetical protein